MPGKLRSRGGKAIVGLAGTGASLGTRKLLTAAWRKTTGTEPPEDTDHERGLGEAIAWAVLAGAIVGVVKLLAARTVTRLVGHQQHTD